jgi:dolichol-phosphate mannosyltransferase
MNSTIIIPTLNEEKNIGLLCARLKELYPTTRIIVSDDGSYDKTRYVAQVAGATIINRTNRAIKGITAAVVHAAQHVTTDNIIVMDADFQHPPKKVGEIMTKLESHDIVIAAREKVLGNWGITRKAQSKIGTLLAQLRLQKKVKDPLSGFFGIRKRMWETVNKKNFELRCFKILFNILKNVTTEQKKTIGYVAYEFDLRKHNKSKIGTKHIFFFLRNLFL